MKYIRTKDGIWLFGGIHAKGKVIIGKKQEADFGYCFDKKDILKQADTIEEVFDQLVYVEDTIPEDIYPALMSPKGIIQSQIILGCTKVYKLENFKYGIWTKKGLKYVAEFNDKGELKLI